MTLSEDLRTYILTDATVQVQCGTRVHHAHMPTDSRYPAIWYAMSSEDIPIMLDGPGSLKKTMFDIEVLSTSVGIHETLGIALRDLLHGRTGTMGNSNIQGAFVEDRDTDYQFRNNAADEGITQSALTVTIWST